MVEGNIFCVMFFFGNPAWVVVPEPPLPPLGAVGPKSGWVDTRALARHCRSRGTPKALLCNDGTPLESLQRRLAEFSGIDGVDLTARVTALIESQVRAAPGQWLWLHDRWKGTPQN